MEHLFLQIGVEVFFGFVILEVVLLQMGVEGYLVEHIVLQEWLGVQVAIGDLCKIGWNVESWVYFDWLID